MRDAHRSDELKEIESRGISFGQEVFSSIGWSRRSAASKRGDRYTAQGERVVAAKTRLSWQESLLRRRDKPGNGAALPLIPVSGWSPGHGGDMTVGDSVVAMAYLASVFEPLEHEPHVRNAAGLDRERAAGLRTLDSQPEIRDRSGAAPRLARGRVELTT